jgi:branched-chain amino acid transport system permease protein
MPAIVVRGGPWAIRIALAGAAIVLILAALPAFADRATLRLATEMAGYLTLAVMWNLLAGYAGVTSIGQQVFVGLGGYAFYVAAGFWGLPLIVALPLAGLFAACVALPVGLVLFRLNGAYLAVASWVVAEVAALMIAQSNAVGGGAGMSLPMQVARSLGSNDQRAASIWWMALGLACCALALSYLWLRSPRGLTLMAMRDDEVAAAGLGVSTARNRILVYLIAALITGLVGAIIFLVKLRISPLAAFDANEWTASIIFIVVIGGLGYLEGPLVGVLVFFALRSLLGDFGPWYLIALGAIAIVTMLHAPGGLWGLIHRRTGIDLFPVRRRANHTNGEAS